MSDLCRRCGRLIRVTANNAVVFEGMHYVCFHYEFEHGDTDPDEECTAGVCPSAILAGGREQTMAMATELASEAAQGTPWPNGSLSAYLSAFAAWLADSNGYYLNQRRLPPSNGWEIISDALRAATVYE